MSKSKRLITASAVMLSMATPFVVSNISHVLAEGDSNVNTVSETNEVKLKKAIMSRDEAYKKLSTNVVKYSTSEGNDDSKKLEEDLIKSEKDLTAKSDEISKLEAEVAKDKGEKPKDVTNVDNKVKDSIVVKIRNVDIEGKLLSESKMFVKDDEFVSISKVNGYDLAGSVFITDKSVSRVDLVKGLMTKENGTLTVVHRKVSETSVENKIDEKSETKSIETSNNLTSESTTKENKSNVANSVVTESNASKPSTDVVFNFNDHKEETPSGGTSNVNFTSLTHPEADKSKGTVSNTSDGSKSDNDVQSKSTDSKSGDVNVSNKSDENKDSNLAKTTIDGVITKMLFNETGQGIRFSGVIDQSKLPEGQKLEGKYAKVTITTGDGTELGTFDVRDDFKVEGLLKSTPKEGDVLIVKYGGKNYELPYGVADENKLKQSDSTDSKDAKKSAVEDDKKQKEKRDAKANLLPSTGQKSTFGAFIAGLVMLIVGAGALFMKLRTKKSEE